MLQSLQLSIAQLLKNNGIEKPELEARLIVETVSGYSTVELLKNATVVTLNDEKVALAYKYAKQRCTKTPLAYILQYKNFWRSKFFVDNRVLIPRPDTEILIELFLEYYKNVNESLNILDIGVGSGNVLLSLLLEYKKAKGVGVDISQNAIDVAQINAYDLGVANRCALKHIDLFNTDFNKLIKSRWALSLPKFNSIVSNPPYIDVNDTNLQAEVKQYEPALALFASNNGLQFYTKIFSMAKSLLNTEGTVLVEIGHNQEQQVTQIANQNGFNLVSSKKDLAKITRALMFK